MKNLLLIFVLIFSVSALKAETGNYTIDDTQLETMFAAAAPVSMDALMSDLGAPSVQAVESSKSAMVAILLDFFLGGFGVHRFYLGTKVITGIGYILTCGGIFGLVPFIDLIVLAVNYNDISKYVDNPKFFMW